MKVLIIDDERWWYDAFAAQSRDEFEFALTVEDGQARYAAANPQYDIIVLDQLFGDSPLKGTDFLAWLTKRPANEERPQIIVVTQDYPSLPARQIYDIGVPISLFLEKGTKEIFNDMLLIAVRLLARSISTAIRYTPKDLFGVEFMNLLLVEADCLSAQLLPGYMDMGQSTRVATLIRSYVTSLKTRPYWDATDVLELSIFFAESLSKVFGLPERLVQVLRKFLDMEETLYTIPRYRDHFFHQIKVFLLGLCIINALGRAGLLKSGSLSNTNGMKLWFLASAFHDIGYPFEKMTKWLTVYMEGVLRNPKDKPENGPLVPVVFPWGTLLGRRYHAFHLQRVVRDIAALSGQTGKELNKIESEILSGLASLTVESADHGLFSSLVIQNLLGGDLEDDEIRPVARAVALHNRQVAALARANVGMLTFEKDQIAFLLAFCDLAQDWGRTQAAGPAGIAAIESDYPVFTGYDVFQSAEEKVVVRLRYPTKIESVSAWRDQVYAPYLTPATLLWGVGQAIRQLPIFSIEYQDASGKVLDTLPF
jgi:hypothetical protein